MSPYQIVFDKGYHLPVEIEHRAYWEAKQCNLAYDQAGKQRKLYSKSARNFSCLIHSKLYSR
ncbi:hypothetical protein CR513_09933, partial [Mucuna pruriens]